ncbi:MAG: Tim44/TimA family putative adaptor protein [Rhodospirillales bacterium]|nr:Tim44/TimA family putative adaptor protein [Rhodospirillales bacterium]
MDGGFQFLDIILFAMIAIFLILRLRGALGRRDGTDGNHKDPFTPHDHGADSPDNDNVVQLPDRSDSSQPANQDRDFDLSDQEEAKPQTPIQAGITQIMLADSSFQEDGFKKGASMAFEMILDAFTRGDSKALKPLLSPEVFANFTDAINAREAAEEKVEDQLVGFKVVEILEAGMEGRDALVTIKFVTEQINATMDSYGRVVDGDPNKVIEVVDLWTFSRDTKSRDPNWFLVATHVPA